jgi:hypothetical protein
VRRRVVEYALLFPHMTHFYRKFTKRFDAFRDLIETGKSIGMIKFLMTMHYLEGITEKFCNNITMHDKKGNFSN